MITATVAPLAGLAAVAGFLLAGSPPAPLPTPVLKQRLAEAQARLWAWEVEYESAREDHPGLPAPSYVHRVVAAKAPDRFFHWNAHGTPRLDWRQDPTQQRLTVTSDRMFVERPLHRFHAEEPLRPNDTLPGTSPGELWLIALGWWPLTRPAPTIVGKMPAALSAIAHSSAYQVRPRLEQMGGRWCHVLECPGRDQLWLDADRGCSVVTRQISYPGPARIHRIEFADFRELAPGIWAPFALRNIHYERLPDGGTGRVVHDAKLVVQRIRLNEAVDDARFRFEPPPGSAGEIGDRPMCQTVPGGQEYLDEVVEWVRLYTPWGDSPARPPNWGNGWDMALGALLGVGVAVALLWRRGGVSRRRDGP